MSQSARTLTYGAVAAVSILAAFGVSRLTAPDQSDPDFTGIGLEWFPSFQDPAEAQVLQVTAFDPESSAVRRFGVERDREKGWVITSHNNYPAEAEERLARTAASLIGITRGSVQSRLESSLARYGVLAPDSVVADDDLSDDSEAEPTSGIEEAADDNKDGGRGVRITLLDADRNALVDLIVGDEVEGRPGYHYVREPDSNIVYTCELDIDLSARFTDWIEQDLLKLQQNRIVSVTVDNYSVDETQGRIVQGDVVELRKDGLKSAGEWTLDGLDAESEEIETSLVTDLCSNLSNLRIVGVRPKPEGLDDDLNVNPLQREIMQVMMQQQGFFMARTPDGERLVSNEGELVAGTDEGVQYTLYFGEVAQGTDLEIEVGGTDTTDGDAEAADSDEAAEGAASEEEDAANAAESEDSPESGPRRYVLVKVDFNEELLGPQPEAPSEPVMPEILKEKQASEPGDASESDQAATQNTDDSGTQESSENNTESEAAPGSDDSDCFADEPAADEPAADEPAAPQESAGSTESAPSSEPGGSDEAAADPPMPEESPAQPAAPQEAAPTADEAAAAPAEGDEEKSPLELAQEEWKKAQGEYEAAKAAHEVDLQKREQTIEAGKKKVAELSARFSGWYYVITADSFDKFRLARKDVVSAKESEPAEGAEGAGNTESPAPLQLPPN